MCLEIALVPCRTFHQIAQILVCLVELLILFQTHALASLDTLGTEQRVLHSVSIAAEWDPWCLHYRGAKNVCVPKNTQDPTVNCSLVCPPLSAVAATGARVQQEATALIAPRTTATPSLLATIQHWECVFVPSATAFPTSPMALESVNAFLILFIVACLALEIGQISAIHFPVAANRSGLVLTAALSHRRLQ